MNLKKKNFRDLFSFRWFNRIKKIKTEKIALKFLTKAVFAAGILAVLFILFACFEIYVPANPMSHERIIYTAQKGMGDDEIARELEKLGILRSANFFRFYVVISFQHSSLQAGKYSFSSAMSTYQIVKKLARGESIKDKITILEGWDVKDIAAYFESKEICSKEDFIKAANEDYSQDFDFLKEKPKDISLEGYLFPDTYEFSQGETCQDVIKIILANFNKKLTAEIREKITSQDKNIFEAITMASMLEKEVKLLEDKKVVSGILWKRLKVNMPLQIDATVNYITEKSDPGVLIKDTKIDSPYNTYKYTGLPKGPISNPGIDSIMAAINPKESSYWYYLNGSDGRTVFSRTLQEHAIARAKYLNY